MAVAHDAVTDLGTFTTTSPFAANHTPVGTPRGVVVSVVHGTVATDLITGVTYGGVAMERVATSADTVTELGRVYLYFLGEGIPTGTQSVSISHTGSSDTKWASVATVTASTDTECGGGAGRNGNTANPSVAVEQKVSSLIYGNVYSGLAAPGDLAVLGTMTAGTTVDFGNFVGRFDRQTTAGTNNPFTFGYTSLTDDAAIAAIAVQETLDVGGVYAQGSCIFYQTNPTTQFAWDMAGALDGKDLYFFGISRDHTSGTGLATLTDNSGANTWTLVNADTDRKLYVFWKQGAAADVGATLTFAGAVGSTNGGFTIVAGGDGASGDPTENMSDETNASGNETHAGYTPSTANSLLMFVVGDYSNDTNAVTLLDAATLGTLEPEDWARLSTGGSDCRITTTSRVNNGTTATGAVTWAQTNGTTKSALFGVKPASTAVTGTGASTLANVTSAGSGTYTPPAITGTGASTLANVTSAGSGTYTPPAITGTGASTLADVTSAGSGTYTPPAITGTGASTLADVTSAGSGTYSPTFSGTGASTLADVTSAGSGTFIPAITGTGASTLENVTSAGSGTYTPPAITGTGASTLENVTSAGSGTYTPPAITGTGAATLENITSAGSGTYTPQAITGTGASTLEDVTSTGSGTYTPGAITGTGASTLEDVTSSGTGLFTLAGIIGSGAVTLEDVSSTGTGTFTPAAITGTGTSTLENITSAGTGAYTPAAITGTGSSTLEDVTSTGTGTFTPAGITGTGSSTLDDIISAGVGLFTAAVTGSGSVLLEDVTSVGVGMIAVVTGGPVEATVTDLGSGATVRGQRGVSVRTLDSATVRNLESISVRDLQ